MSLESRAPMQSIVQRVFEFANKNGFFVHDTPGVIFNFESDVQIPEEHAEMSTTDANGVNWSFPDPAGFSWAVFCLPVEEMTNALILRVGVADDSFIRICVTGVEGHADIVTANDWVSFSDTVLKSTIALACSDD